MRGLAKYVMTGRTQAIIAVVIAGLLPLFNIISPAIVGLVILRQGLQSATPVLLFAILAAAALIVVGASEPLMPLLLITVALLATLLRATESWPSTVFASVPIGLAAETIVRLQPALANFYLVKLEEFRVSAGLTEAEFPVGDVAYIAVSFGFMAMLGSLGLLMFARSMQAGLYNPGGFQAEFHQLRLSTRSATVLVAFVLLPGLGLLPIPSSWMVYGATPLFIAGLALAHGYIAKSSKGISWLVALYASIVLFPYTVVLLMLIAIVDTRYDFRKQF